MNPRPWEVEWVNGWVRDAAGNDRSPVWLDRPEYGLAHETVDRWAHDLNLEPRVPRIGPWTFWWPLRFVLHRNLARVMPQLRLLHRLREEGPPPRSIVLRSPPDPWWPDLLRLVFPESKVTTSATGKGYLGARLAHAGAFVRRAHASSRRVKQLSPGRRTRILVLSQDRMWDGMRDGQLDTVLQALERGGLEPVVLSRPWGSPAHRLMSLETRPRDHLFVDQVLSRHLLSRGYPRPPSLELPPSGFQTEGFDLTALVHGILRRTLSELYRQREAYYRTMPDLVKAVGVRAAVVSDENGGSHGIKMGLMHAGVPVVAVQHGVIHRDHLSYAFPEGTEPQSVPLCRATCVYGNWDRNRLVEDSIYPAGDVTVTGHVQMDTVSKTDESAGRRLRREHSPGDGGRLLFFTSQGEFRALTAPRLLKAFSESRTPNVLVIRPHPQEGDPGFWDRVIRDHGVADRAFVRSEGALEDWLSACDVHLSVSSTVLGEAALFDKPSILIGSRAAGDFCGCLEGGVGIELDDHPSLDAALDTWFGDPATVDEHRKRRERYVQDHFHHRDGRAGERVAAVVERVLS